MRATAAALRPEPSEPAAPDYELIEGLFFAYRDFVGDPDRLLGGLGFGRAHHRVLHFVARRPGLTVAELLDVLQITKQSLARVLKDLVAGGFVAQLPGAADRRQRHLEPTPAGQALARDLAAMQTRRLERAIARAGPGAREVARAFLAAMAGAPGAANDDPRPKPRP